MIPYRMILRLVHVGTAVPLGWLSVAANGPPAFWNFFEMMPICEPTGTGDVQTRVSI